MDKQKAAEISKYLQTAWTSMRCADDNLKHALNGEWGEYPTLTIILGKMQLASHIIWQIKKEFEAALGGN